MGAIAFGLRAGQNGLGTMLSILLLLAGMILASWVAVLCGIRAPMDKGDGEG